MAISLRLFFLHRAKRIVNRKKFRYSSILNKGIKKLFPKPKNKFIVKTLKGFNLIINPKLDKGIEYSIYKEGIYEEGTLDAFECIIAKGDVILDLGGNIGLTTIYASKLTGKKGKVYSFEAHPGTFEILKKNIELNKCLNVTPVNFAVSDDVGSGSIYENLDINRGAASLMKKNDEQNFFKIPIITLDKFLVDNKINDINLVKMDIEGYELNALKGMKSFLKINSKPVFCIELSFDVNTFEVIDEIFTTLTLEYNYLAYRQKRGKTLGGKFINIEKTKDLPKFDNIYFFQKEQIKNIRNIEFNN